jgi:transposase
MLKAFEYRIYPNREQREQIAKHIGSCRWIYNYALEKKMKAWTCKECGTIHDRDINASINIKNIGLDNRNKIPTERRKSTLGENRGTNLVRLTQEAPAFRQG